MRKRFRFQRRKILIAGLLISGTLALFLFAARNYAVAVRREMYLPTLQRQAADDSPRTDSAVLPILGWRLVQAHEYPAALQVFQRAAEQGNRDGILWLTWSATAAANDDIALALGVLKMGRSDPKLAPVLDAAQKRLDPLPVQSSGPEVAFAISPQGPEVLGARYGRANWVSPLLEWWGRRFPARSGFATREKWATQKPDDSAVQVLWARALARNHRFPDAEKVLLKVLRRTPKDYNVLLALADMRYAAGLPARAGQVYRALAAERPDWFPAVLGLARSAVDKKLVYLGAESAQKAVELNPKSAEAWATLGEAYFNQKLRWDKACEAFESAQRLDPKRLDYYGQFFDALRLAGRPGDAETLVRRRLDQDPTDARAHFLLATALLDNRADAETVREAEKHLRESLRLYPDSATARTRLGQLLLERGEPREAATWLQGAAQLDPYSDRAFSLLARALRRQGDQEKAREAELAARKINAYVQKKRPLEDEQMREPSNIAVRQKLAAVYREGGETDKARQQDEAIYMLKHYPAQAKAGLNNLMNERALSASMDWPTAKNAKSAQAVSQPATPEKQAATASDPGNLLR